MTMSDEELLAGLRRDILRLHEIPEWEYVIKTRHARVLTEALERGDAARAEVAELKKSYDALDKNWSSLHEAFTSAIRKALELPEADLRELVERIDDLKAPERVSQLHVFQTDCNWVVAYDVEDAWRVLTGTSGVERDEFSEEMTQLPDDDVLPIQHFEIRVRTTCADWCKRAGRGFLCSTEF